MSPHARDFMSWVLLDPSAGCWIWEGAIDRDGYGQTTVNRKPAKAHRHSWTIHYGIIPDGAQVLHHCDVPSCVRPEHLFLGTNNDNVADKVAKGRQARGEAQPGAKLTDDAVRAIIRDERGQCVIAMSYGVCQQVISHIKNGLTWKHVAVEGQ